MLSRIENIMLSMNTMVLSSIYHFVESAYTPRMTRANMPILELPTGVIFAGINVPDHDLLFQQIARILSSPTPPTLESASASRTGASHDTPIEQDAENHNHVVILQSKDCANLKATLKSMIEQFLGLGIAGAVNPLEGTQRLQNYDMIALERWYQSLCDLKEERGKPPKLVVIIQDFESFDQETLQDLITICHSYQTRIPFVFLMGLATSIDALHQGLPKSVLSLLQTRKFQVQQSSECLTVIIEDLFIHGNVGLMVGPLPLKQLIDQFMHYNFSVGGFVANLKYIVMHHFYANPLSILCDRSLTTESKALELLNKGHLDHIRMLPSFQRYVETQVEADPQVAEMLLLDDGFLIPQIPGLVHGLQEYHQNFSLIFDFLWFVQSKFSISVLRKSKRALYFMALEGTLTTSSSIVFLLGLVRKLNSNDMMVFIEDTVQFFQESPHCSSIKSKKKTAMGNELVTLLSIRDRLRALLDTVSEDSETSSSETEDHHEAPSSQQQEEPEVGSPSRRSNRHGGSSKDTVPTPAPAPTIVKKRKLVSLKANDDESRQTRIAKKSRETSRLPKGVLGTYTLLVTEIDEFLAKLFSTYLDCHTKVPLNEIFYYSQVTIQQKAFLPQPRASIQTALGQPELYLNCDCCHPPSAPGGRGSVQLAEMVLPTQHDTCILYKLYVECGRLINMYDWFTAFGMILERGLQDKNKANSNDKDKDEDDDDNSPPKKRAKGKQAKSKKSQEPKQDPREEKDEQQQGQGMDQKEVQARFISGVAELQFMGFIRPTNRKTDHVQRLTWGNI